LRSCSRGTWRCCVRLPAPTPSGWRRGVRGTRRRRAPPRLSFLFLFLFLLFLLFLRRLRRLPTPRSSTSPAGSARSSTTSTPTAAAPSATSAPANNLRSRPVERPGCDARPNAHIGTFTLFQARRQARQIIADSYPPGLGG